MELPLDRQHPERRCFARPFVGGMILFLALRWPCHECSALPQLQQHRPSSGATVQKLLKSRGITTFLDRDNLVAGLAWSRALEQGLREVKAVAVFIGR